MVRLTCHVAYFHHSRHLNGNRIVKEIIKCKTDMVKTIIIEDLIINTEDKVEIITTMEIDNNTTTKMAEDAITIIENITEVLIKIITIKGEIIM